MPANVEYMASANGVLPWHEIGYVFEPGEYAKSTEEMLRASRTNTRVELFHLFSGAVALPDQEATDSELAQGGNGYVPGIYALRRTTDDPELRELGYDGTLMGIARSRYRILQNADVAEFLSEVVKQAGSLDLAFRWETMGTLDGGKRFFATLVMPDDLLVNGSDKIARFLLGSTSHDGTRPFIAKPIMERVVCANTLGVALRERTPEIKIRHTTNMDARVQEAVRVLSLQTAYQQEFADAMERLAATSATLSDMEQLACELFPVPADATSDKEQAQARRNHDAQMALVGNYVTSPTLTDVRETAYGLWNAVTEYEDWKAPRKNSKRDMAERATEAIFDGALPLSQSAFDILTRDWDDAPATKKRGRAKQTLKVAS